MRQIQVAEAIAYLRAIDAQHTYDRGSTLSAAIANLIELLADHARDSLRDANIWDGFDDMERS